MSRLVQVKGGQLQVDLNRQLLTAGDKALLSDIQFNRDALGLSAVLTDLGPGMLLTAPIALSGITTNAQTVATITPGFAAKLDQVFCIVTTAATTAAKLATIGVFIDPDGAGSAPATAVSGGVLALTSATVTPVNTVIGGSIVVDSGATPTRFGKTAVLTFVTTALPTAFVEGAVMFGVMLESTASFKPGPFKF